MLPPYIPSAAEKADPVLYAANIRKLIVSGWGVEHDSCPGIPQNDGV
jgi:hypothetical protein